MKKINNFHFSICLLIFLLGGIKTGWGQDCTPRGTNEKGCPFKITIGSSITELDGVERYNKGNDIDIENARQPFIIETSCEQLFYFAVFFKINGEKEWKLQTKGSFKEYFSESLFFPVRHIDTRKFPEQTKFRIRLSTTPFQTACGSLQSGIAQSRNRGIDLTVDCGISCQPCPRGLHIIRPTDTGNEFLQQILQIDKTKKQLSKVAIYPNPIYDNANLIFTLATEDFVEIVLFDISGKQKKIVKQKFTEGKNIIDLNLVDMPAGFYTILLKTTTTVETLKIIKS